MSKILMLRIIKKHFVMQSKCFGCNLQKEMRKTFSTVSGDGNLWNEYPHANSRENPAVSY
jgi:hypothetical protein